MQCAIVQHLHSILIQYGTVVTNPIILASRWLHIQQSLVPRKGTINTETIFVERCLRIKTDRLDTIAFLESSCIYLRKAVMFLWKVRKLSTITFLSTSTIKVSSISFSISCLKWNWQGFQTALLKHIFSNSVCMKTFLLVLASPRSAKNLHGHGVELDTTSSTTLTFNQNGWWIACFKDSYLKLAIVVLGFVDTFYICGCLKKNTIKDIWWENEWSKLEGYRMNIPFLLVYFHSYLVDFTNNCTYDKSSKYSVQYSQVQWQKPLIVDTVHWLKKHVWFMMMRSSLEPCLIIDRDKWSFWFEQ